MATLNVNIDKPPIPTGNTLWVDAINGDDATGTTGRQDLPYLTLTAAKNAASSGDLVHVRPGTYNENNLLKDGVNWYFDAGAIVTNSDTELISIFDNTDAGTPGPVSCVISGYGSFRRNVTNVGSSVICGVIVCEDPDSVISIRASSMTCNGLDNAYSWVALCLDGNLTVKSDTIVALGSMYAAGWSNGTMYVSAKKISGNYAVHSFEGDGTEEHMYVDVDEIDSPGAVAVSSSSTGTQKRVWLRAAKVVGEIFCDTGLVYVDAQKIEGVVTSASGGTLYVTTQKYIIPDNETFGGTIWLDVNELSTTGIFQNDGTNLNMRVGQWTASGDGLNHISGSTKFTGRIIANSSSSVSPVVVGGSGLVLGAGTVLVADLSANSISASSAQTVMAYSSKANTSVDANVTIEGSLQIEAGAATVGQVPIATARGTWAWGAIPDASETTKGIIEIATAAEVAALNDTTRAVTSANLKSGALIDVTPTYINYTGGSIATTSTSFADLHASAAFTGLAPGFYIGEFYIGYNAAATTTGARFALNGTVTQDYLTYLIGYSTQSGDRSSAQTQGFDGGAAAPSSIGTTGNNAILQFSIHVTGAGDIAFRFASEVGGSAVTVTSLIGFIRRVS